MPILVKWHIMRKAYPTPLCCLGLRANRLIELERQDRQQKLKIEHLQEAAHSQHAQLLALQKSVRRGGRESFVPARNAGFDSSNSPRSNRPTSCVKRKKRSAALLKIFASSSDRQKPAPRYQSVQDQRTEPPSTVVPDNKVSVCFSS